MKIRFNQKLDKNSIIIHVIDKKYFGKQKNPLWGESFEGKYGEISTITRDNDDLKIFFGLGDCTEPTEFEQIGWKISDYVKGNKIKNITLICNGSEEPDGDIILSIINGIELSNYIFDKYFSEEKKNQIKFELENINVIVKNKSAVEQEYNDFLLIKENIFFCRDIVNEPANIITPESYAKICKNLEKTGLEIEIFEEKDLEKLGANAILAVGQGSNIKPKMVVLKWNGGRKLENPVVLVGKGLTFDSGGLSLKPENAMYDMKCDMAGSAVVVSTIKLLAERKANVNAVGIIGLAENMPSGNAIRPGDVIKSMSGKTIEILNTDAEGRVVLADLLHYATTKFKPEVLIDLATLTGAICVALGEYKAGIFANNDKIVEELTKSSKKTGEEVWRMPLGEIGCKYDKMMNSDVADVKNISGSRNAGSITAAQFLQRFINGHKKWAHMDIAGTAFTTTKAFFVDKYATGYGVRLLNDFIKENYENK